MFVDPKTGLKVHPAYLQPMLIGWKPGPLPNWVTVQCLGPTGRGPIDMMGRTRMSYERRTVVRRLDEDDASLQKRIDKAVMWFKKAYGWNQSVSVLYEEGSRQLGWLHWTWDRLINTHAWVCHMRNEHTDKENMQGADMLLALVKLEMRRQGVGCVPPGLH